MQQPQFKAVTDAKLSREDFPISAVFIDFLARWLDQNGFCDERWPNQLSEKLNNARRGMRATAQWRLERMMCNETAQQAIDEVYGCFYELMMGRTDALSRINARYQFLVVVGIPRTGGSYLTAEMFSALGHNPTSVPSAIAHDGFPDAQPLSVGYEKNAFVHTMLSISEYLAVVDLYFAANDRDKPRFVPKKLTKGVYAGGVFNTVLGKDAEYWITIRHPIAACISTYEKSGGLPDDGLFKVRSAMEKWIKRDLIYTGVDRDEIRKSDYFGAYVRYWEQYYISLAMSGLTTGRTRTVVPYSRASVEAAAQQIHNRLSSSEEPTQFISSTQLYQRHPRWIERAEEALDRVGAVWRLVGLPFPGDELAQCS